jgi:uncharacterized protein (TIRG00374 family)
VRKFIIALVLLLGVYFLIVRFAEIQNITSVLVHGRIGFIFLALGVQLIWIGVVGLTYHSLYRILGIPSRPVFMARVATAATFVNVVAPVAGLSSVALFISNAHVQGHSPAKVTVASVLFVWMEYTATLIVLVFGLGEMARRNNLHWSEITASAILLAGALGIAILLYLGMVSAHLLGRVLAALARGINFILRPFIRRDYLCTARAYTFAAELAEGISVLRAHPHYLVRPVLLALLNKSLLVAILALTFLAFDVNFNLAVVVAGFSIAYLFLIVSPTPAGLGIVEGVMTVALRSLEIPIGSAAVITLAYRGITFWFPLLVGMVAFRSLPKKSQGKNV